MRTHCAGARASATSRCLLDIPEMKCKIDIFEAHCSFLYDLTRPVVLQLFTSTPPLGMGLFHHAPSPPCILIHTLKIINIPTSDFNSFSQGLRLPWKLPTPTQRRRSPLFKNYWTRLIQAYLSCACMACYRYKSPCLEFI